MLTWLQLFTDLCTKMTLLEEHSPVLPDAFLKKIFRLLPIEDKINFERVCRKWESIGAEEDWKIKEVDLCLFHKNTYSKILRRCGSQLRKLTVNFSNDEVPISALIKEHCRHLQKIIIKWDENVEYPRVKHLYFFDNMDEVFDNNKGLKSVEIIGYHRKLMSHFVDYLRMDTIRLKIFICKTEKHEDHRTLSEFSVDLSRLKALETLQVSGFISLEKKTLRGLEKLEKLRDLRLEFCLMSERFIDILSNLQNLENLQLKDSIRGADLAINETHQLFKNRRKHKFLTSQKKYQHSLHRI